MRIRPGKKKDKSKEEEESEYEASDGEIDDDTKELARSPKSTSRYPLRDREKEKKTQRKSQISQPTSPLW